MASRVYDSHVTGKKRRDELKSLPRVKRLKSWRRFLAGFHSPTSKWIKRFEVIDSRNKQMFHNSARARYLTLRVNEERKHGFFLATLMPTKKKKKKKKEKKKMPKNTRSRYA
ncbi:hypothetical protein PUN28_011019 [Cardiocondyla obscurior]|uniref:Uncharacterized protein n=1 Tax=Cardiocondyla obscurior TaxID=286306 RepID=A0AAW2FKZ4_9HYME